jgi:hypothetical protein
MLCRRDKLNFFAKSCHDIYLQREIRILNGMQSWSNYCCSNFLFSIFIIYLFYFVIFDTALVED